MSCACTNQSSEFCSPADPTRQALQRPAVRGKYRGNARAAHRSPGETRRRPRTVTAAAQANHPAEPRSCAAKRCAPISPSRFVAGGAATGRKLKAQPVKLPADWRRATTEAAHVPAAMRREDREIRHARHAPLETAAARAGHPDAVARPTSRPLNPRRRLARSRRQVSVLPFHFEPGVQRLNHQRCVRPATAATTRIPRPVFDSLGRASRH